MDRAQRNTLMELLTREIGEMVNILASGHVSGSMARFTQATGKKDAKMDRAQRNTLMEMFTREIGKMTTSMDLGH
jgi:hypothetical protein